MVAALFATSSQWEIIVRNTFVHVDEEDIDSSDDELHYRAEKRAKTQPVPICVFFPTIDGSDAEVALDIDEGDDADEGCCSLTMIAVKTNDPFEGSPSSVGGVVESSIQQRPMPCLGMGVQMIPTRPLETMEQKRTAIRGMRRQHSSATTVILRNLPLNYKRSMVQNMLDREGFAGKYDFLYRPAHFETGNGVGYAFVNLSSAEHVPAFWKVFDGYKDWVFRSSKVCSVSWSTVDQGLAAHIERFRNAQIMHQRVPDEYKPIVLEGGMRIAFPPPTQHIDPPTCPIPVENTSRPRRQRGNCTGRR